MKPALILGLVTAGLGAYVLTRPAHAASSPGPNQVSDLRIPNALYRDAVKALAAQQGTALLVIAQKARQASGGAQTYFETVLRAVSSQISNKGLGAFKVGEPGGSPALSSAVTYLLSGVQHPGILVTWKQALLANKLPVAAAALEKRASQLRK